MSTSKAHLQIYTIPPTPEHGRDFHFFPQLPFEIRRMIWTKILERPRFLRVHLDKSPAAESPSTGGENACGYRVHVDTRRLLSKLLRVNRESRQVASEFYRVRMPCTLMKNGVDCSDSHLDAQEGYLAFNPEYDFLYITSRTIYIAHFLYDLKTTYDPRHIGLRNLATEQNLLNYLLYSLDLPNHIDAKVRETVRGIFSQLYEVFFVNIASLSRQIHRRRLDTLMLDRDTFNRSYPIMTQTGPFERLHRDPRHIAHDLNRILMLALRLREDVVVWNEVMNKLEISAKSAAHISYRLLITCKPSVPPYQFIINDRECATAYLEKEDENWMDANRDAQELDPRNDDLERAVRPAFGFWLFPIDALDAVPHEFQYESYMLDLTNYWPELALLSL